MGSVYALVTVGYVLIYGLINFISFAHSITVTIGISTTFFSLTCAMQGLLAGITVGVIATTFLAAATEFVAYCPSPKRSIRRVYLMIIRLGISVMGDNPIIIVFSGRFRISPVSSPSESIETAGTSVDLVDMLISLVGMISPLVVELIIRKIKLGLVIRSAAFSLEATPPIGVDISKLIFSTFLIARSLAGVAGALLGAKYMACPSLDTFYTSKAFICVVSGGLGSLPRAVMGALMLGASEAVISVYVSTSLRDLLAYFLLIMALLTRPSRLMGKSSEDKV